MEENEDEMKAQPDKDPALPPIEASYAQNSMRQLHYNLNLEERGGLKPQSRWECENAVRQLLIFWSQVPEEVSPRSASNS
ncbi:hypothetical protein Dda_5524 [Drechslerella dactyloides]|uniref:Uncharacterized protein n=1 Tax=Drechslerella dactyloides TaxID=74499 RepID=A0AAD6IW88_DREDA|nr:hypothetical protein Dda_5524 [Drechslerella dactyloides]